MAMEIFIRNERPEDQFTVENLTREAFWNLHVPGCDEHFLVRTLRDSEDFLPELNFVAEVDGRVVGNIMFSRSRVVGQDNRNFETITFGPVSVLPEYQRQGIGRALIERGLKTARTSGHRAAIIFGNPAYYARFGFRPGKDYNIRTSDGKYAAALQVLELFPGTLTGVCGRFLESKAFEINPKEAEEFDRLFPHKEKRVLPSQAEFIRIASMVEDAR